MLYLENSYDQFTFASTVTDWITVTDTESATASGNSGLGTRVWTPLKEAVRLWAALTVTSGGSGGSGGSVEITQSDNTIFQDASGQVLVDASGQVLVDADADSEQDMSNE